MEKPKFNISQLLQKHSWADGTIDRSSFINASEEIVTAYEAYAKSQYFQGKIDAIEEVKNTIDSLQTKQL